MKRPKLIQGDFERLLFFIFSPVLSLPLVLYSIYQRNKLGLVLFTSFFAVISFIYIPYSSNDKAVYLELYDLFKGYSYTDFNEYLIYSKRPDFVLHLMVFFFSVFKIPSNYIFFITTFFTVGVIFKLFHHLTKKMTISKKDYFISFLLITFSISLPDLFSGIRFYFASAMVLLSYFLISFKAYRVAPYILLILALFTHFSSLIFVPFILVLKFLDVGRWPFRLFLFSLPLILIPGTVLINLIPNLSFNEGLSNKAATYLLNDDFILKGIETGSGNYYWIYLVSTVWVYFAIIYLIATRKKYHSEIRNLLYLTITAINFTFAFPTIYSRYLLVVKILFALVLIEDYLNYKNRFVFNSFLSIFFVGFIFQIIILRTNFSKTLVSTEVLSSLTIFTKDVSITELNR